VIEVASTDEQLSMTMCAGLPYGYLKATVEARRQHREASLAVAAELLVPVLVAADSRRAPAPELVLPISGLRITPPYPVLEWQVTSGEIDGRPHDVILHVDTDQVTPMFRMDVIQVLGARPACAVMLRGAAPTDLGGRFTDAGFLPPAWVAIEVAQDATQSRSYLACSKASSNRTLLTFLTTGRNRADDDEPLIGAMLTAIRDAAAAAEANSMAASHRQPRADRTRSPAESESRRSSWRSGLRFGRGHHGVVSVQTVDFGDSGAGRAAVIAADGFRRYGRGRVGLLGYYGYDLLRIHSIHLALASETSANDLAIVELRMGAGIALNVASTLLAVGVYAEGNYGKHRDRADQTFGWDGSLQNAFLLFRSRPLDLFATLSHALRFPSTGTLIARLAPLRIESRATAVLLPIGPETTLGDLEVDAAASLTTRLGWGLLAGASWRSVWATGASITGAFGERSGGFDRTVWEAGVHFPALTTSGVYDGTQQGGWLYINSVQVLRSDDGMGNHLSGFGINRLADFDGAGFPLRESIWFLTGSGRFELGILFQGHLDL
jgi:hypothetical protein